MNLHYVKCDYYDNLSRKLASQPNITVTYDVTASVPAVPIGTLLDSNGNKLKEVLSPSATQTEKKKLGYV